MDLPPDKANVLRKYDDDKKWDLICDQVSVCLCHLYVICVSSVSHLVS